MNLPVIAPTNDNPAPCANRHGLFLSAHPHDHKLAKQFCKGNKNTDPCPFIGWCIQEREASQEINGRTSIEGTWHGQLFVDGTVNPNGKRQYAEKTGVA